MMRGFCASTMEEEHQQQPEHQKQLEDEQKRKLQGDLEDHARQGHKHEEEQEQKFDQDKQCVWNWSWGAGTHGQLATGEPHDKLLPQPLSAFATFPIQSMACGGSHAAAVSKNGEVVTWGNGRSGQLGHGHTENLTEPIFIKALECIKILSVSAGWSHTAFVSADGNLFTCGSGGFGQLGHGNFETCYLPTRVREFASLHVSVAACGMRHTLALIDSGECSAVYAFGSSKRGQLGIVLSGQKPDRLKRCLEAQRVCLPQKVVRLDQHNIVSVHCNGDHSAALSDHGDFYLWGRGYDGNSDVRFPSRVSNDLSFCQVALGWNHVLALTNDGLVYAGGCNWHGNVNGVQESTMSLDHEKLVSAMSVGHPPIDELYNSCNEDLLSYTNTSSSQAMIELTTSSSPSRETQPGHTGLGSQSFRLRLIDFFKGLKVVWVAAGSEHSAVALDDGTVMTWGWGEHGQLGLGTTDDQSLPQKVPFIPNRQKCRCQIFCGSGFTFICMDH